MAQVDNSGKRLGEKSEYETSCTQSAGIGLGQSVPGVLVWRGSVMLVATTSTQEGLRSAATTNYSDGQIIFRKGSVRGRIQDCPNFSVGYPLLYQERIKLYELQILYAHSYDRSEQKPISNFVAVGVPRDSRKFSGHPYIGRIARSSLW